MRRRDVRSSWFTTLLVSVVLTVFFVVGSPLVWLLLWWGEWHAERNAEPRKGTWPAFRAAKGASQLYVFCLWVLWKEIGRHFGGQGARF